MSEIVFPYQFYRGWDFPVIKFYLAKDQKSAPVKFLALLDSGANVSLFNAESAHALGLTLSQGKRRSFNGVAGAAYGYEHELYFDVVGEKFRDKIIFSSQMGAYFNIIGRDSFFKKFQRVCFEENRKRTVLITK